MGSLQPKPSTAGLWEPSDATNIPDRSTVRRLRDVLVRGVLDVQGFSKRREERAWLLLQYPSNVQARSLEE
jgi:hypothetical protein